MWLLVHEICFKVTTFLVFLYSFIVVLAGKSGAVVVAVVGALAGLFGSSGIDMQYGMYGSSALVDHYAFLDQGHKRGIVREYRCPNLL